jgi:hypothetical protein
LPAAPSVHISADAGNRRRIPSQKEGYMDPRDEFEGRRSTLSDEDIRAVSGSSELGSTTDADMDDADTDTDDADTDADDA